MTLLKKIRTEVLVLLGYLLVTVVFTYPLVFKISSSLYGYTSDNFSAAWHFWWLKFIPTQGLTADFIPYINAPFGIQYGALAMESFWVLSARVLSTLGNELLALNTLFLLSFPLAGMTMYFLSYYLFKNKPGAFIAGLIFAFAPYHFWQGYAHISLTFIYTLPLFLLALFYLNDKPSVLAGVLLALSFVLVFLNTFYYGLFMALVGVSFFLVNFLMALFKKESYFTGKRIKALLVSGLLVMVLMTPSILDFYSSLKTTFTSATGSVSNRTLNDFLSLSLRPWDLFLPAPDHPLFGELSKDIYKKITTISNDYKTISAFLPERVVYLGILPSLLALVGIIYGLKNSTTRKKTVLITILLILVTLFALPPVVVIKGINFYFPSYLIYLTLPPLRVLVRFGVVILLFVSLLASIGVVGILKRFPRVQLALVVVVVGVILVEFLPLPPSKVVTFDKPPEYYQWLKEIKEDVIVAEYPARFDLADALIWQRYHQKKLFNMFSNEYHQLWDRVSNLESVEHADILASLGVKYVIFHTDYLYQNSHPFDDLYFTRFSPPPTMQVKNGEKIDVKEYSWLKLLREYSDARVYELAPTNAKFFSYNPKREKALTWIGENSLVITKEVNTVYLFNFGAEKIQLGIDFEIEGAKEKLIRKFYNGIETKDLNKRVLELRPGFNVLRIDSNCLDCGVKLKNIKITKLK